MVNFLLGFIAGAAVAGISFITGYCVCRWVYNE